MSIREEKSSRALPHARRHSNRPAARHSSGAVGRPDDLLPLDWSRDQANPYPGSCFARGGERSRAA
jgi:hypothetical protein